MPSVTINIAKRGNPLDGGGQSSVGHMWYALDDGQGNQASYGFSPASGSSPYAPGGVNAHGEDNTHYKGPYYYSRRVGISQEQYDAMKNFGETTLSRTRKGTTWFGDNTVSVKGTDGQDQSFTLHYNGLSNSCIDYTWKAMEVGGLNPDGYEGKLWPTSNKDAVDKALDKFSSSAGGGGGMMQVCMGATLMCSFGMAPSNLVVLPINRVITSNMPAANIMDHIPMVNILPFGVCTSLANPTVAAATSAAMGVLTPMPCIPATATPWVPGVPTVLIANMPAVDNTCTLNCMWAGIITVANPGQMTHMIP